MCPDLERLEKTNREGFHWLRSFSIRFPLRMRDFGGGTSLLAFSPSNRLFTYGVSGIVRVPSSPPLLSSLSRTVMAFHLKSTSSQRSAVISFRRGPVSNTTCR
jgi:hypothetical protein